MRVHRLAFAGLIAAMVAGAAAAQQNEVKVFITKPKEPSVAPADQGNDDPANKPPRTITRGKSDPAPAPDPTPVVNPAPAPAPAPLPDPAPRGDWLLASDPEAIRTVLSNAGYRAELTTDDAGNPLIVSEASRSQFWISFLDCGNAAGCLAVEFYVGYSVQRKPPADAVNQFNADFRYIRAYVSGDVASMAMDVLMQNGGVDVPTFLEYLRLWSVILPEWETAMGV
jgi:hypothetical protein